MKFKIQFPSIEFVDEIVLTFQQPKTGEITVGAYMPGRKHILILKNRTKTWRTILHELIHWLIDMLPVSGKRKNIMDENHDRRSTFITEQKRRHTNETASYINI